MTNIEQCHPSLILFLFGIRRPSFDVKYKVSIFKGSQNPGENSLPMPSSMAFLLVLR